MLSNFKSGGRARHSPLTALLLALMLTTTSFAATFDKANNANNLILGSSWVGGVAPGSADIAQWSSVVTGANTTSLGADVLGGVAGLKITNPGGTVTINAGNILGLAASGLDLSTATTNLTLNCALNLLSNQSWNVASGRTLTIGGNVSSSNLVTLPGNGTVTFNGGSAATYTFGTAGAGNNALAQNGGTVNFQSGTATLNYSDNADGAHINGNSTFNLSGGTVNSPFYTRLGSGALGTTSTLNVTGGMFKNTGEILFGFGGTGGSGTLTISGGTVSSHFLRMGDSSANGTHTVNLNGGTLMANQIFRITATAVFNFNGGLLMANDNPTTPWFQASVTSVFVKNGGAIIATSGQNVTLEPPLQPFSGSTGGLTKLGEGTLTLAGISTYNGPTVVSNGTLAIKGRLNGLGAVTIASGGTLGGTGVVAGVTTVLDGGAIAPGAGQLTVSNLTMNPYSIFALTLGAAGSPANSSLRVNGNLVLDGTVFISDSGSMATNALYSVINYTGALVNNGLVVDPNSAWNMTVDTSLTNFVRLTATQKFPLIEITGGDLAVTSLYTNLTAIIHGAPTNIVWYEVRSNSLTGILTDFGAHPSSAVWPFTVRHLKGGTNWVTVFARNNAGVTFSNSIRLVLDLPANTSVRPRPIPAEMWWGGLSVNQHLVDPTKPWDFVKQFEDGIFFHSYNYGGLTAADKSDLATMMRPYSAKYWVELGGDTTNPTETSSQQQGDDLNYWLGIQQNLGLVMSQVTHDYHAENMEPVCRVHPAWPRNNQIAWWTGDLSITNSGYPLTTGIWRDVFNIYYTKNPHLKLGHTSSPVWWPWDTYPALGWNVMDYNPLKDANGVPILVSGTNVSFVFNQHEMVDSFINMSAAINHPSFSFQTDCPWDYYGAWSNVSERTNNRAKIRLYEKQIQARGARHTFICNVSDAQNQPGGDDAQDIYYKTNSLNSIYTHQLEGGRANTYLFESWYFNIPHAAAPESKEGSYANLALDAIRYLKGIKTNGTLQGMTLTLTGSGATNTIQLTNTGDFACLPAVAGFETGSGSGTVNYYNAAGSNITALILSAEGYVPTARLAPGQSLTIRVVPSVLPLNRTITLEAFWNPQDPTGVVRSRLTLTPPNPNLILNGVFTANAAAFTTFPGYTGGANPASITNWSNINGLGVGVNGTGTGVAVGNPFGPTSTGGRTYAFVQGGVNGLSQNLPLTSNATYQLDFDVAVRVGNTANYKVEIVDATQTYFTTGTVAGNNTAFIHVTQTFTTPGTLNGTPAIKLWNLTSLGDNTVDYANVYLSLLSAKTTTTTALVSSANPITYGNAVTLTATVTTTNGFPTGTITFKDGINIFATSPLVNGIANTATAAVPIAQPAAGSYSLTATYDGDTNFVMSVSSVLPQVVNVKPLTVTGVTAGNKVYDGGTLAALSGTASLVGVVIGDTVTLGGTPSASFANANVGIGKPVNVSGYTLGGASAANYSLTQPTLSANITARPVALSGIRVYDGTTAAAAAILTIGNNLDGANLTLSGSGTLAGKDVGVRAISAGTLALGGSAAGNYTLTGLSGSVTITVSASATALSSSLNPSPTGANVNFTTTVSAVLPGGGTPTNQVRFRTNGISAALVNLNAGAQAIYATTSLPHGSNIVTAEYVSDGNFLASTNSLVQGVNTAPVANAVSLGAVSGVPATLQIIGGANAPTDADDDPLTVTSVSAPAHGIASTDGTNATYTATNNYSGSDSFNYTVSDNYGATATNAVTVNVIANSADLNHLTVVLSGGDVALTYLGIPGNNYALERTFNLIPPAWVSLATNPAPANGYLNFTNTPQPGTNNFWRTRLVP